MYIIEVFYVYDLMGEEAIAIFKPYFKNGETETKVSQPIIVGIRIQSLAYSML